MGENQAEQLSVDIGDGLDRRSIAVRKRNGAAPGLFWLGGFNSEMNGAKASALDGMGARRGLAVTRFDYSGCGRSGGDFAQGTISRWLDEAEAVFQTLATGEQVLVGSSMGGWLALLLNKRLRTADRVKAIVLIAPAVDMTESLMRASFTPEELAALERTGRVERASPYSDAPTLITRTLIQDGVHHLLFGAPIETGCPVHILQGGRDPDVPHAHALKLVSHLLQDEVTLSLIPDGDHRLSRPEDIERLEAAVVGALG